MTIFTKNKYSEESELNYYLSKLSTAYAKFTPALANVLYSNVASAKLECDLHLIDFEWFAQAVVKEFRNEDKPPKKWFIECLSKVREECSEMGVSACRELEGSPERASQVKEITLDVAARIDKIRQLVLEEPAMKTSQPAPYQSSTVPLALHNQKIQLLAIHVEAAGSESCWQTMSVEFLHAQYKMDEQDLTLGDRKIFSIRTTLSDISPRCIKDHWSKKWDKFKRLQKDAKSYEETANSVTNYVSDIFNKHPDITILSRNVVFDTSRLNELLRAGGKDPIAHRPNGAYLPPIDLDSMARALAIVKETEDAWARDISSALLFDSAPYEEDPTLQICHKFVHYNKELQKFRVHYGKPILAVDVKAGGFQMNFPVISVGFCHVLYDLATKTFNYCLTKRFDFKVGEEELDPKCVEDCWQYRKEAFKFLQENAQPYDETAKAIVEFLQPILNEYPGITIVSDNISFDIDWLNSILISQKQRSILNRVDNVYQTAVDLTELQRALAIVKSTEAAFSSDVNSDRLLATFSPEARAPVTRNRTPERAAFIVAWDYVKCVEELHKFQK